MNLERLRHRWSRPIPWSRQMLLVFAPLGVLLVAAGLHLGPLDPGETYLDVGLAGAHYWAIGLGSAWAVLSLRHGPPNPRLLAVCAVGAMVLDVRTVVTHLVHPLVAATGLYHAWWPHEPVRADTINPLSSWAVLALLLGVGLLLSTVHRRTRSFHRLFAGAFLLSVISTHVLFHLVTIQAMRDRGEVETPRLQALAQLPLPAFFDACDAQRLHCGTVEPDGTVGPRNPHPGDGVTLEAWRWQGMAALARALPATPGRAPAVLARSDVAQGPHGEVLGAFVMAVRDGNAPARLVVDTVLATRLRHRAERRFEALGAAQTVTWLLVSLGAALFHATLRNRRRTLPGPTVTVPGADRP